MSNINTIIIPDVHGRKFWRKAVSLIKELPADGKIIFLGDYLDPYGYEGITSADAIVELMAIVSFAKDNPRKVELLLGNHDGNYLYEKCNSSRKDWDSYPEYNRFYTDNRELFKLATEHKVLEKKFLFTHAGVHPLYLKDIGMNEDYVSAETVSCLNYETMLYTPGPKRSWVCKENAGSPVWCDITEFGESEYTRKINGYVQIVGHTQLNDKPININNAIYDLDVRRPFMIDYNGNVCEMSGEIIPKTITF